MTKHITLISSQTTHHLNTSNFHGPLERYHHQKTYFTKRHHIWSNVSPTVDITKRYCMNNKKNIIKTGKNQKRNITSFNPPYSKLLKTKTGKYFFRLLNKHFPPRHELHKIFNKNFLTFSYSCIPNLKARIMDTKKCSKTHRRQNQTHTTVWKEKTAQ